MKESMDFSGFDYEDYIVTSGNFCEDDNVTKRATFPRNSASEQNAIEIFEKLLREYPDCYTNSKRFEGLLRDYFINDAFYVNLLSSANKMDIEDSINETPSITKYFIYRETKKLEGQGFSRENASLSVRIWCESYGSRIMGKEMCLDPDVIAMPPDDTVMLNDICGQKNNKNVIRSMIDAADLRNEPLGSILICGPENSGKFTLACAIANEAKKHKQIVSFEKTKDSQAAAVLTSLGEDDVLILQDVHKTQKEVVNLLIPAIRNHSFSFKMGPDREMTFALAPFSVIATIPDKRMIPYPLFISFDWVCSVEPYSSEDFLPYIQQLAYYYGLRLTPDAMCFIADNCNGQFIRAKKLLLRLRDFAQVENADVITLPFAQSKLSYVISSMI